MRKNWAWVLAFASALLGAAAEGAPRRSCALSLEGVEARVLLAAPLSTAPVLVAPALDGLQYFPATGRPTGPTSGEVTWEAPPDVARWEVFLAGGDLAYFASVGSTTGNHLTVTGLRPGTTYDGYVLGTSANGRAIRRSWSVYIDTPAAPNAPPIQTLPTIREFRATVEDATRAAFSFFVEGALTLSLERKGPGDADFQSVADFLGIATAHTDTLLPPSTKFLYRLAARNEVGVTVTEPIPVETIAASTLTLTDDAVFVALGIGSSVRIQNAGTRQDVGMVIPFAGAAVGSAAFADVNRDGIPDLIVGTGGGSTARVRAFDGRNAVLLWTITPFEDSFEGMVNVATGDLDGDGTAEVVIAAGDTGGPRVRVFDASSRQEKANFFASNPDARGGATVAVGDFDGDGAFELAVGAGRGEKPEVRLYRWRDGSFELMQALPVFAPDFLGGVYVGTGDYDRDGADDLIAAAGPTGAAHVRIVDPAEPGVWKLDDYVGDSVLRNGAFAVYVDRKDNPGLEAGTLTMERILAASRRR